MHLGRALAGIAFLHLLAFSASAQVAGQTPQELVTAGSHAYNDGKYADAETAFAAFLRDFGESSHIRPELKEATLRLLGYAQLRQGKFEPALPTLDRYLKEYPDGQAAEDFAYWRGVALFKDEQFDPAAQALTAYAARYPRSDKKWDAACTAGAALLAADKYADAAAHFAGLAAAPGVPPAMAGKAKTFQLFCLVQLGKKDEALALVRDLAPQSAGLESLALFHFLALQVGNELLTDERWRDALAALQTVWPKEKIIRHQREKIAQLEAEAAEAEKRGRLAAAHQHNESRARIEKELGQLQKIPDYDTALQMRIAQAFYKLERHREAALILGRMVQKLPDSPLLEQSNYLLLTCYVQMQRWGAAVQAAQAFAAKYPQSKLAPSALYLAAEAMQRSHQWQAAADQYAELLRGYPKFEQADRMLFLRGYALLMLDKNAEAIAVFDDYRKKYPTGSLAEAAYYWEGMAHSFAKEHEKARDAMATYLSKFPSGAYAGDAVFRRAHALYATKQWQPAIGEFEDFLKKYPAHARADEASLLLGDCWYALGDVDQGIARYRTVSEDQPRLYELAYFNIGKGLKAQENLDALESHFREFIEKRGESGRVVEALHQVAWAQRQKGNDQEARDLYWQTLDRYGNAPRKSGVEEMITGLAKLHKGDEEKAKFLEKLRDITDAAKAAGRKTLAARGYWAQAQAVRRRDPRRAQALLLLASNTIEPKEGSPVLLADIADALRATGQPDKAVVFYEGLVKWYPRAVQKDRSYAGIGLVAAEQGKPKEALEAFARFERELVGSPLVPQVLAARADIRLERGEYAEAIRDLERVLAVKGLKGQPLVDALAKIGNAYLALGQPDKAVPYFQRIYIMYGAFPEYVAEAYWGSGQAFEKLNRKQEALDTYKELVGREELKPFPPYRQAAERLQQMGGAI